MKITDNQLCDATARAYRRVTHLLRNRPELRSVPMGELALRSGPIGQACRIYLALDRAVNYRGFDLRFVVSAMGR